MKSIRSAVTIGAATIALAGALSHPVAASAAEEQIVCVQVDPNHWQCGFPGAECTVEGVHGLCAGIAWMTGLTLEMFMCVDGGGAQCLFGEH